MAVTAAGSRNQAGSYLRDPISHIRFGSGSDAFFFLGRTWPGSSLSDPNRIRFCTSGPVPVSMRYPRSVWTERSQIRPASGETDPDHIRYFCSGPYGHCLIRIRSVFVHLARILYGCVIHDLLVPNEARPDVIRRDLPDDFSYVWSKAC